MKWRSAWPIFHGPVILPYILKTIWCMNIILWDYESVWPDVWPQNKCRSLWPIFHGPVSLPYIFTVWCMNIILRDYESVWPDVWPQNKCDLYFMVPWLCLNILKTVWYMNIILWDYESVWHDIWSKNKCRSIWPNAWAKNICRTLWPIFHGPVILPYILKTIHWLNITLWDYESFWPNIWPQNVCRSLWPIFHGPLNLPYVLKSVWCMNIILWDYESVWHDIWPWNKYRSLWPIFYGPVILPYILNSMWWMDISVLLAKRDSGEPHCPATALIDEWNYHKMPNVRLISEPIRPKKYMCVSGFSSEKTRYGRFAWHFILSKYLYRICIFQYIFPHLPANLTTSCSQVIIKCLELVQKPR